MDKRTKKTHIPAVGAAAISLAGHDRGRIYLVVAVVNHEFVLCADGKYRCLDKPKLKRFKHLKIIQEGTVKAEEINNKKLNDSEIYRRLKELCRKTIT